MMGLIDHTLLKPYSTAAQVESLIDEAAKLGTYSVCIAPLYARLARERINSRKYDLRLAVVVDFPLGAMNTEERNGVIKSLVNIADEIDIVVQIGTAKSGRFGDVLSDLKSVSGEAHAGNMKIKVITEDAYLTGEEKPKVYEAVFMSGADFIKTSTGFADEAYAKSIGNRTSGADIDNVKLMNDISKRLGKGNVGIKVSGGVRTYQQILDFIEASGRKPDPLQFRVGASGTAAIYEEIMKLAKLHKS